MSVKKYVIKKNEGNFTVFPNKVLQNINNYGAVGLYTYLSSLPPGWEFYKKQLQEHGGIGRTQLDTLLKVLVQHNLVHCVQKRNEKGHFAHFEMQVNDGDSFVYKDSEENKSECVQPFAENGLTVNGLPVNDTYKGYKEKEDINTKEISNNYSATDVAQARANDDAFENYWRINPVKKNRIRAKKIWDKKKLYKIETVICADILNRLTNDPQWQDRQYIPHPSTYLFNELWNDEIVEHSSPSNKSASSGDSLSRVMAKYSKQAGQTYDQHGNDIDPFH